MGYWPTGGTRKVTTQNARSLEICTTVLLASTNLINLDVACFR